VRKITPQNEVTTFAAGSNDDYADGTGSDARFGYIEGISIDRAGNLYIGDYYNHRVRKITPQKVVTTLAGNSTYGFANGIGEAAQFEGPGRLVMDNNNNLYVTDEDANMIRKIAIQ
jgi:DNA-binding beta-propeller fold protein YncE